MKKLTYLFMTLVFFGLITVPTINLVDGHSKQQPIAFKQDFLFNFDFVSRRINQLLYPLGISLNPENVIIGEQGWLYLGDAYNSVRSVTRRGSTVEDIKISQQIDYATREWERWLKAQGRELI